MLTEERIGHEEEVAHGEGPAEIRMSLKSIMRAYRKEKIRIYMSRCSLVVAPGYI